VGLISRTTSKLKEVAWEVEKMGGWAVVAASDFTATGEIQAVGSVMIEQGRGRGFVAE
jgi:short-subunit dehydrogenase